MVDIYDSDEENSGGHDSDDSTRDVDNSVSSESWPRF